MNKEEIVKKLVAAKVAYYNSGTPIMTDFEYDALEDELRKIDPDNDFFNSVGTTALGKGDKIELPIRMFSTDKALSKEELQPYMNRAGMAREFVISLKKDGMSIGLKYENGKLVQAFTRGNGTIGIDKTDRMGYVPAFIPNLSEDFTGYIYGEAIMSKENFKKFNEMLEGWGEQVQSNPRNSVAGLINSQNVSHPVEKFALISFFPFGVFEDTDSIIGSYEKYTDQLDKAKSLGFTPVQCTVLKDLDSLDEKYIEKWVKSDTFECDGVVIRVNDNKLAEDLGASNKYLNAAIALKFKPEMALVTVKEIEWMYGSREVTPLVKFDPVELSGAMLQAASGHSVKNLIDLEAYPGNQVTLVRSGEVIPRIYHKRVYLNVMGA